MVYSMQSVWYTEHNSHGIQHYTACSQYGIQVKGIHGTVASNQTFCHIVVTATMDYNEHRR